MHESRLFKIVYHLLDQGRATAPELAKKLEVSVRTIYRDLDALSEAGIPIYTEPGRNGGIRLMEHFTLDRAVLSKKEKQEILTGLQSLGITRSVMGNATLEKLSGLFHLPAEDWLETDFSRWGEENQDNGKFERLKEAILKRRAVRIQYAGSDGKMGERTVHPLKLAYKSRAWYLRAYCMDKQDFRIFRLTRIVDLEVLDETFSGHACPREEAYPAREYNQIVLRFSGETAYRVYDEFDRSQVERQENGDLLVSARMPEDDWLTGFLLSFGTGVEVVEPAHLREVLAAQAEQIYQKNKAPEQKIKSF